MPKQVVYAWGHAPAPPVFFWLRQVPRHRLQAIEEETERVDQAHTQEQADIRLKHEEYEKEVMRWKVQCFDQQYER